MSKVYKHGRPTIGVLAGWQVYHGFVHSFLDSMFRGIRLAAEARDCNLLFACGVTHGLHVIRPAWPLISVENDFVPVGPWNTDGLIVATPLLSETRSAYIQRVMAEGHPVVFAGLGEPGPAVVADNAGGIRQALAHLAEHGHRRIAFLAGIEGDTGDSQVRLDAYRSAVQDYGLEADPQLIVYSQHTAIGGRAMIHHLLGSGLPFTAVLASNDDSAMGAMEALHEAGRRIPEDVAVMGFDDRLEATGERPTLSTVHYPTTQVGAEALELLLRYIQGEITHPEIIRIPTRLVIRQSCGCRPGRLNRVAAELRSESGPQLDEAVTPTPLQVIESQLVQAMIEAAWMEVRLLSADKVNELCQRLVGAFSLSVEQAVATHFYLALEEVLYEVERVNDDPHAWQAVFSALEGGTPALLETLGAPAACRELVKEMLRQARINISESVRRQYRQHIVGQRWSSDQRSLLAGRLLAALDEVEIFRALAEHLPRMGVQQTHVMFFKPEKDDPVAWSERRTSESRETQRFPSREFPPADLYALDQPFHLALLPLIVQDEISGFVAFVPDDLALCATIVWQLTAALKSAQLYRLKNRFLSTVSHELRTPLNLIVGLSEVLLREQAQAWGAPSPSIQSREDMEQIHASAQHLSGLIRDVLDLASSEAGRLKLAREPLDLRQVLEVVMGTGQQLAQEKDLIWRTEIPESLPWVLGDRTRLRQVALNLVSNAIKFTERGTITLKVERIADFRLLIADWKNRQSAISNQQSTIHNPQSGDSLLVSVSDTGLGIPPAEQSVIFDEFRQSERTTARGYGGLGLGLAICKRLIELHGGEIGVHSSGKEGEGSTFYFTLPIWEGEKISAPPAHPQTVLLLTESSGGGEQLQTHLERQGFEVEVRRLAGDGAWLPQIVKLSPGAVVLELGAASERGWDILKVLKDHPGTRDLPVLFYSLAQEQDSGAVLEMDYLMKPVEADDLTRALARQGLEAGGEAEKKTILIVDDEPGILDLHTRMVQTRSAQYEVLKAKNGREALSVLERERVDLVLLDLMMPELDGFGVLETMRERAGMRDVPVIVLTSQVLSEDDMARLNRGVVTVLGKGMFNAAETLGHVEAALERNRKLGSEAQRLVRKGMAYVHEHYAEALTREALARYIGVSEDYLTRCFRQELGVTPMAYLNRYRVSRAKDLLAAGRKSVTEVAIAVGFSDTKYFGRVFRREVGVSPGVYKRSP